MKALNGDGEAFREDLREQTECFNILLREANDCEGIMDERHIGPLAEARELLDQAFARIGRPNKRLNLDEAATYLGLSRATIKRMASCGELPAEIFGRSYLISSSDLDKLRERARSEIIPTGRYLTKEQRAERRKTIANR